MIYNSLHGKTIRRQFETASACSDFDASRLHVCAGKPSSDGSSDRWIWRWIHKPAKEVGLFDVGGGVAVAAVAVLVVKAALPQLDLVLRDGLLARGGVETDRTVGLLVLAWDRDTQQGRSPQVATEISSKWNGVLK